MKKIVKSLVFIFIMHYLCDVENNESCPFR